MMVWEFSPMFGSSRRICDPTEVEAEIALANIELGRRRSPARVARFQVQPWAKPPDRP